MSSIEFPRILPEPAHEAIKRHDDLLKFYSLIKEKYQPQIDQVFDRVSQQIGFVVATALPFTFEIENERVVRVFLADGEQLKGTLFDQQFGRLLGALKDDPLPIGSGVYRLYLFWYDALKLRLRTDWMEPPHHLRRWRMEESARKLIWESREPPHWLDPRMALTAEEAVMLAAIDEVYPELRLADRIGQYRRNAGPMGEMPAAPG